MSVEEKRRWWILSAMTTCVSMIFIDVTILPVALPSISRELQVSNLVLQWILNAYTLALTVLVLAGGRLADIWGLKKAFYLGIVLFAGASALCGISSSAEWLIFSRALQGVGGALLIPSAQGILISSFPPHERGKAVGLFVSIGSIFLALGPLIGGSLTQYLNWRYAFWINLPIAAIGLILTSFTVPYFPPKKERFDMLGFISFGIGASSIVIAVMNVQEWGWFSPLTLSLMALGIFLITVLLRSERKISHPLFDIPLMKTHSFIGGLSAIFCMQFLIVVTIFWAIYFQDVLRYTPSQAGFIVFLSNAPVLMAAPLAGFLVDRFGPRRPVLTGFSLVAFSLIWLLFFHNPSHFALLLPALIPFGFGIPLISTPSFVSMMNHVSSEKRGIATGAIASIRQFGATLGLAIFGSISQFWYHRSFSKELKADPLTQHTDPTVFEGLLSGTANSLDALKELPLEVQTDVTERVRTAYISAFDLVNSLAAVCALVGIYFAFRFLANKPIEHHK